MDEDTKTCPRCAETIKAKAVVCRFCGHEMEISVVDQPVAAATMPQRVFEAFSDLFQYLVEPISDGPVLGGLPRGIALLIAALLFIFVSTPKPASQPAGADTSSPTVDQADADTAAAAEAERAAERKRTGETCLSLWDGSVPSLVRAVKDQLRDPNSFEHDETSIFPVGSDGKKDGLHPTKMTFRSKNGFGGMTSGYVEARVAPETCDATVTAIYER